MNKFDFSKNYENPQVSVIEVEVERGFLLSGGSSGEAGSPDEEM